MLTSLPIDAALPDLFDALDRSRVVVLQAPTGAGKTTRLPPALLDRIEGQVWLVEPRRVAARAAAGRIAKEQGWKVGEEVGWQVRFDKRVGPNTRLVAVTEGVLVRRLQEDPFLEGIGAIVLDEFHERHLPGDVALAMLRRVREDVRDDLVLVVMSATLDPEALAATLDGVVVRSEGRQFPVDIRYDAQPDDRWLDVRVADAVRRAWRETEGDVLAFLPGVGDIRRTEERLEGLGVVRSLYGDLPADQQDAVLSPTGPRQVVLATNIAESSLTLPRVSAVVDCGLEKRMVFDPATGLDRLETTRIGRRSADQRAGRAGRTGPGVAYRLWTRAEDLRLPASAPPEIARVDLTGAILELRSWGEADPASMPWLDPPDAARVATADALLTELGALADGTVTATGRQLASLPLHPRLGRLVQVAAQHGQERVGCLAAAVLSERDVFVGNDDPSWDSPSDLHDRVEALTERGRPVHRGAARAVRAVADQLAKRVRGQVQATSRLGEEEALGRAVLAAWPDRVCRRRDPGEPRAAMVGQRGVVLSRRSAVRSAELFVAVSVDGASGEGKVHIASAVERPWLDALGVSEERSASYDADRDRVIGLEQTCFRDLVLRSGVGARPEPWVTAETLAAAAWERRDRVLPSGDGEASSWLARCRSLARWRPELDLPSFESEQDWREVLPEVCHGARSLGELTDSRWLSVLRQRLDYRQREALEREAPERLTVPSGSNVRLRYQPGEPPVLAVRMQELFGCADTPTVASGRVRVRLELLAPNMRAQQVTDDLAGFWERTWPEVRKELRGRYPRHSWPEDPTTAPAMRGARRRRT